MPLVSKENSGSQVGIGNMHVLIADMSFVVLLLSNQSQNRIKKTLHYFMKRKYHLGPSYNFV